MNIIIDFMLLAASGGAAFYCYVLSRRLEQLKDTNKGIGASIATLSQTLEQTRHVFQLGKEHSAQNILQLTALLEDAHQLTPELMEMIDTVSELSVLATDDIKAATQKAEISLQAQTREARTQIAKFSREMATKLIQAQSGAPARKPKTNVQDIEAMKKKLAQIPGKLAS